MTFNLSKLKQRSELSTLSRRNNIETLFDSLFNDFYSPVSSSLSSWQEGISSPRLDISETDSEYCVEAELPGINKQDIDIKVNDSILTIKGKREETSQNKDKNYYMRERYYGSFQRSISLPPNINTDKVDAKFENGILCIKIPKKQQEVTKKIEIKSENTT